MRNGLLSVIAAAAVCILAAGMSVNAFAEEEYPCIVKEAVKGDYSGKLVIVHSNDVHGAIDGYAYMTALKKNFEDQGAEVIMIDAGDFSQGDPYVNVSSGDDAVKMMNVTGYDYATLGNHEFDYGQENLFKHLKEAKFRTLCANVLKNGETICGSNDIYKAKNGVNIGFFGLVTPSSATKVMPSNVKGLKFLQGKELDSCTEEQITELKDKGADLIIAISHLGVGEEAENAGSSSVDIYAAVKGMDFMIDGHSHTEMTEGTKGEPIQSTGTKFKNIGIIVIDGDGRIEDHYLLSTEGLDKDSDVEKAAKEIEKRIDEEFSAKIGYSELELAGGGDTARDKETALGDLASDAWKWYISKNADDLNVDPDHAVVIQNGGGIRESLPEGDISKKTLNTIYPFGGSVSVVYVSGTELLEALEASTFCTPEAIGGFPQTEGIKFTIDTTKEFDRGEQYKDSKYYKPASIQRVTIERINGHPFRKSGHYAVITNDFCADGGDTYHVFSMKDSFDTGALTDEVLSQYINEELGGIVSKEKYGKVRGDITIITSKDKEEKEDKAGVQDTPEGSYKVTPGDSLWKIAIKTYDDGYRWTDIYELNKKSIKDPSVILVGSTLKLPA